MGGATNNSRGNLTRLGGQDSDRRLPSPRTDQEVAAGGRAGAPVQDMAGAAAAGVWRRLTRPAGHRRRLRVPTAEARWWLPVWRRSRRRRASPRRAGPTRSRPAGLSRWPEAPNRRWLRSPALRITTASCPTHPVCARGATVARGSRSRTKVAAMEVPASLQEQRAAGHEVVLYACAGAPANRNPIVRTTAP